jgi:hypothetical protein
MDYYQGVVMEYVRANRSNFVNPEFLLALGTNSKTPPKGEHWYVDLLTLNLKDTTAYLCEVSYSVHLSAMRERLAAWASHWPAICAALRRDAGIGPDWTVRPWLFAPEKAIEKHLVPKLPTTLPMMPKITPLEMTVPWRYCTWDHPTEHPKPPMIPEHMW